MSQNFDALIVGAGQAGPPLAGRLTAAGWSVALIERKDYGGTCVNTGCTPTKALVASAKAAHTMRQAAAYGLPPAGELRVDLALVKARKDAIVAASRTSLEAWLQQLPSCTLFRGTARFASPTAVQVGEELLEARHIFLNVGARPASPALPGIGQVPYLTSSTLLALEELPTHLLVVGAGAVGLEFAQLFRRLGAQVTLVERNPRLLPHEDADVAAAVTDILAGEGIALRLGAECIGLAQENGQPVVHVSCAHDPAPSRGSHLLLALGRQPNTDDLALEKAGLQADAHGYIPVNDQLQTATPGIWALGDCNGRGAFTHTSYNDFEIVTANLLDHDPRRVSDRLPVSAIYLDPPFAKVGLTETEVRAAGIPALIGKRPMTEVGRAVEKGETQGFIKVLVHAETDQILGASIVGVGGDEAIHCIITAMYAHQTAAFMRRNVFIHPTVSELIPTVFGELKPLAS
ncbi:FAD-containing oxidoreductase [Hymenobacter sp. UV11]|uniref:FAD-containing oxidoreductase n=1 Tax=Hymenobacter sp. UV11 TaxID=1849735 RepID=UPI00105BEFBB|nr:FAD-containing oxidoreductase [Hymenobacter sp. UV11]TDN36764.1 mercuric reductase [Hymenobacter sp. UV11]TFZ63704.1 FAD-containing oxidoreductase [Hymenobacter sp. UV11]